MSRWTVALPAWVWILVFVVAYVLIKSPDDGMYALSLPVRVITGIGNFFILLFHRFAAG